MEGPAELVETGVESFEGSEWASTAKLLLVEGIFEEGVGFFPPVEGFLLCLLRGGTLVKPSGSDLSSASLFRD